MAVVYYPKQSIVLKRDTVSSSFEQVVLNTTPNTILYFGSGSLSEISGSTIYITSSHALTASFLLGFVESASFASFALSASWAPSAQSQGSISSSWASSSLSSSYATLALNSINGSVSASYALTASYSSNASSESSSYSLTASYALNGGSGGTTLITGSSYPITSSWAVSASWAPSSQTIPSVSSSWASSSLSSSYATLALNVLNGNVSASYSLSASYAPSSPSISSSYALTASYALNGGNSGTSLTTGSFYPITSSWAVSASWAPSSQTIPSVSSSWASSSISSSYAILALNVINNDPSSSYALSSSYAPFTQTYQSNTTSASWASSSLSSSYSILAITASYAPFTQVYQNNTVSSSWASSSLSASYAPFTQTYQSNTTSASWASSSLSASYAPFVQTYQTDTVSSSWASSSLSSSFALTASYSAYIFYNVTQSLTLIDSASWASSSLSSSYLIPGTYQITSSWTTNLPAHTSSWAGNSIVSNTSLYSSQSRWATSASYSSGSTTAATANTATNLGLTAYDISVTHASQSRWATSASWASSSLTSSYLPPGTYAITSSWVINLPSHTSSWANNAIVSNTTLYSSQSQWSVSSSYASASTTAVTSTTATNLGLTAYNISVTFSSQSVLSTTSSWASSSLSASYAPFTQVYQSNTTSASWASSSLSSSYSLDSSRLDGQAAVNFLNTSTTHQSKSGNLSVGTSGTGLFSVGTLNGNHPLILQTPIAAETNFIRSHISNRWYHTTGNSFWTSSINFNDDFFGIDYSSTGLSFKLGSVNVDSRSLFTSSYNGFEVLNISTNGITLKSGSFVGTSSWASKASSSAFASSSLSSSYLTPGVYQITSSWADNSIVSNTTLYASQSQLSVSSSIASSSIQIRLNSSANNVYYYPNYTIATSGVNSVYAATELRYNPGANSLSGSKLNITSSLLGNVVGTASWANNTLSSIYSSQSQWAVSSSWASSSVSASYAPFTQVYQTNTISSSWASSSLSASWAPSNGGTTLFTGSFYPITSSVSINSITAQTSDYSLDSLYSVTSSYTLTASYAVQKSRTVSASFANPFVTNALLGDHFRVTVYSNFVIQNPINGIDSQKITWEFLQDPTGTRTITYDNKFSFGSDLTSSYVQLNGTGSKRDFMSAIYNSIEDKWYVVAFAKGF